MILNLHYQDFKLIFTVFLFWISIQFGQVVEDSIAYFMVLSLGIVHGANDLFILKKKVKVNANFFQLIVTYLSLILACSICFFVNSFVSLLLFVLLSAYHFGEQHFENKLNTPAWSRFSIFITYGLLIFFMLFYANLSEVNQIVNDLTHQSFTKEFILYGMAINMTLLSVFFVIVYYRNFELRIRLIKEIFYLALLLIVFKTTTLVFGFAIYFILWHSIPSIGDQIQYLSGSLNKKNMFSYFKKAGFIWILSIILLLQLYFFMEKGSFSSAIFLVLFAVTAPHTWVMHQMKKTNG